MPPDIERYWDAVADAVPVLTSEEQGTFLYSLDEAVALARRLNAKTFGLKLAQRSSRASSAPLGDLAAARQAILYRVADPRVRQLLSFSESLSAERCGHLARCRRIGSDWI